MRNMPVVCLAVFFLAAAWVSPAVAVKCPKDMIPVGDRFCIDRYEFPNMKGSLAKVEADWGKAAGMCEYQGKRLCEAREWSRACGGPDGLAYPYGPDYTEGKCNDPSLDKKERSLAGMLEGCAGPDGTYDMSGNVYEWAVDEGGNHVLMGGSYKTPGGEALSCTAVAQPALAKERETGFRCCYGPLGEPEKPEAKPAEPQVTAEPEKPAPAKEAKAEKTTKAETGEKPEKQAEKKAARAEKKKEKQGEAAAPGEFAEIDRILRRLDKGLPAEAKLPPEKPAEEIEPAEAPATATGEEVPAVAEVPAVEETVEITAATDTAELQVELPKENFFIVGTDVIELGNIVDSGASGARVSASGVGMTFGIKFPVVKIEHTITGFKLKDTAGGAATSRKVNVGVLHASFPLRYVPGLSWSRTTFGLRHFSNSAGRLTEMYADRTYRKKQWSFTPGIDYLQSAVGDDGLGGRLAVSYHLNRNLDLTGNMITEDFNKMIINGHILQYTPTGAVMGCDSCSSSSGSAGVKYRLKKRRADAWLMLYDIGDLDAPMAGITAEF